METALGLMLEIDTWNFLISPQVFPGNTDGNSVVCHMFNNSLIARHVRLYPQSSHGRPCLRFELYGGMETKVAPADKTGRSSPRPHVFGYFQQRRFFSPNTAARRSRRFWYLRIRVNGHIRLENAAYGRRLFISDAEFLANRLELREICNVGTPMAVFSFRKRQM